MWVATQRETVTSIRCQSVLILSLDTTTRGGSVAVTDDERVLAVVAGDASRTHGERLPGELARALEQAGVSRDRIELLAVATGPGAFTGLRIGLAAMQGLAMTLGTPVIGVSALDALAAQAGIGAAIVVPWMDAQRGDVFATVIDRSTGTTLEAPTAAHPQALLEAWRPPLAGRAVLFIGDAVERDAAIIDQGASPAWQRRAPAPLAPEIARLAYQRALRGEGGAPRTLEPIYVRRPDAEIERERLGRRSGDREGGRKPS